MASHESRRYLPRAAIARDPARERAADRAARGIERPGGKVSDVRGPAALGLGTGQPLPRAERAYFERRLGADLASVRVHPDIQAAQEMGARGFAAGRDIGLAPGQWRPGTEPFRHLLGHEIAHTLQQGQSGPVVQLDEPTPLLKETKAEDAAEALGGGIKLTFEQFKNDEAKTAWAKDVGMKIGMPIWNGMTTGDKVATIGAGALMYGLATGPLLADPKGRQTLSGLPIGAPLGLIPYSPLHSFSFDAPKGLLDPTLLHFGMNGDDLLGLAADHLSFMPRLKLSFDFTLAVGPSGAVSMPSALATLGVMPGVTIGGGFGLTSNLTPLTSDPGGALRPNVTLPQPAQPAPPGGVGGFITIDVGRLPAIGPYIAPMFDLASGDRLK